MSLRKKLDRVVANEVELHVPPADPMAEVIKEANVFSDNIKTLVDERNQFKQRAEWLIMQLQTAQNDTRRLLIERDYAHRQFLIMLRANGELKSTITALLSLGNNARNTLLQTDHLLSQHNQQQPPAPKEEPKANGDDEEDGPVDLDQAFIQGAPEPTQEEIDQLRTSLTNLSSL